MIRRILWNLYALPITVLILAAYATSWYKSPLLISIDFLFSIPSLIVLHLNIWDVEVGTPTIRKLYASMFLVWETTYNVVICPQFRDMPLTPSILFGALLMSPIYFSVFSYAFRSWNSPDRVASADFENP